MINWEAYKQRLMAKMEAIKANVSISPSQAQSKIASAIIDGYVSALSDGSDTILKACVIILPPKIKAAKTLLAKSMLIGQGMSVKLAIDAAIMLLWAGATLDASTCSPLPGHVGHSPVSTVFPTGIMSLMLPIFIPDTVAPPSHEQFVDNLIAAMKIHAAGISGMHPVMMLPAPAPPYPLPWVGYI